LTPLERITDGTFRGLTWLSAWLAVLLVVAIVFTIARQALPGIREYGLGFFTGRDWDLNKHLYGLLPQIWGTLYSSMLALVLGGLLGIAVAIFLSEHLPAQWVRLALERFGLDKHRWFLNVPEKAEGLLNVLIELLAAIPSVVYGLWGLFVLIPLLRTPCNWLHAHFGWIPLFSTPLSGPGMLPASLVLAIMILPTVTAISRDALLTVPDQLRQAAYGLGATRCEAILGVAVPAAFPGLFGALILGWGRALGETMALAMLCGNANTVKMSLFSPANTIASHLANTFPEAGPEQVGVLMYAALILLGITLVVNVIGTWVVQRTIGGRMEVR